MNKKKSFVVILLLFGFLSVFLGLGIELSISTQTESIENQTIKYMSSNDSNSIYLSDIEYIKGMSYAGWDQIRYDQINDGSKINLKIENSTFSFDKGIWAHASSQIAYDISDYDYKYFTAFVGLNTTSARGDGVKFQIVTSEDGKNWEKAKYEEIKLPQQAATFVKIDIKIV